MSAAGVREAAAGAAGDGYFEHTRPEVRRLVPEAARRVLDVGCGTGALGAALREERGIEVFGIEGFAEAAARARERLDGVVEADLDALDGLPWPRAHFDAMVFGDVLEHLRAPDRALRALLPWLAPGGAVVCSIPNVKHWSVVFPLLVHDRWRYEDAGLLDRTHVHFFTLEEIGVMLAELGLAVESVAATTVTTPPRVVEALGDLAASFGADREETAARLAAYQYLVVARAAA